MSLRLVCYLTLTEPWADTKQVSGWIIDEVKSLFEAGDDRHKEQINEQRERWEKPNEKKKGAENKTRKKKTKKTSEKLKSSSRENIKAFKRRRRGGGDGQNEKELKPGQFLFQPIIMQQMILKLKTLLHFLDFYVIYRRNDTVCFQGPRMVIKVWVGPNLQLFLAFFSLYNEYRRYPYKIFMAEKTHLRSLRLTPRVMWMCLLFSARLWASVWWSQRSSGFICVCH